MRQHDEGLPQETASTGGWGQEDRGSGLTASFRISNPPLFLQLPRLFGPVLSCPTAQIVPPQQGLAVLRTPSTAILGLLSSSV